MSSVFVILRLFRIRLSLLLCCRLKVDGEQPDHRRSDILPCYYLWLIGFLGKETELLFSVLNACLSQTSCWKFTTSLLYSRKPCNYVHKHRTLKSCNTQNAISIQQNWTKKVNVLHYFLGDPCQACGSCCCETLPWLSLPWDLGLAPNPPISYLLELTLFLDLKPRKLWCSFSWVSPSSQGLHLCWIACRLFHRHWRQSLHHYLCQIHVILGVSRVFILQVIIMYI
jgi:hypothetical protein